MKVSLGPLRYYWPRERVLSLYADVAQAPVDVVYLGETVCPRRRELRFEDWLELGEMLADAGKEVVLSTLALVESEADLRLLRRMAAQSCFRVEANDMAAVNLLARRDAGPAFVAGATLNVWNSRTLAILHDCGATRWVVPAEMSGAALARALADAPAGIETEVLVHGRLPLAYSARCFTARHYELQKDACEWRCIAHPDGLALRTREGRPFLTLNGIETQSAGTYTLVAEFPALRQAGVDVVRISPQAEGTVEAIALVARASRGEIADDDAKAEIAALLPGAPCNGFWHARPGADYVAEER